MHRLRPFPDELLVGIVGRLCEIYACTGTTNLMKGLRHVHSLPDWAPTIHVLAEHLESTPAEVAFEHTLQPIQRAFSVRAGTRYEEVIDAIYVSDHDISSCATTEARSCIECANADLDAGGITYWRRIHNIRTVDWCLVHQIPLMRFSPAAFGMLPVDAAKSLIAEPSSIPPAIASNSALGRFSELLRRWLRRKNAFSSIALNKVIQEGCRQRGLRHSRLGTLPLVSDLARDVLPQDWLKDHWPKVANKTPGVSVGQLDGPSRRGDFAYPGITCALVLAILFDSVGEIEARLESAHDQVLRALNCSPTAGP